MIKEVEFRNFKVLRNTKLPLQPFTLVVGPNGSGKTTALQALQSVADPGQFSFQRLVTAGVARENVEVIIHWGPPYQSLLEKGLLTELALTKSLITRTLWLSSAGFDQIHERQEGGREPDVVAKGIRRYLSRIRSYSLDGTTIANPVQLHPGLELAHNGANLAAVLDQLRDNQPERFEALNEELGRWLPEFDRILFDTPNPGVRSFLLRTREGQHRIQAMDLSQGTLFALAILTLAYLPKPPPLVCIEEPDRGIHPRLLRDVRDALYRLTYPESFDEKREPVQVVATTHSPYFLDLFRDHPEEIVIAQRVGSEAQFEVLSSRRDLQEILESAHLGDVWYSGILGGVPSDR